MKRTCTPGPDPPMKRRRTITVKSESENNSSSCDLSPNKENPNNQLKNNIGPSAIIPQVSPSDEFGIVNSQQWGKDEFKGKQASREAINPRVKTEDNQFIEQTSTQKSQPSLRELFKSLCPNELKLPVEAKRNVSSEMREYHEKRKPMKGKYHQEERTIKVRNKQSSNRRSSRIQKMKPKDKSNDASFRRSSVFLIYDEDKENDEGNNLREPIKDEMKEMEEAMEDESKEEGAAATKKV